MPFVLLKLRLLSFLVGAGVSKVPPLSIPFLLFIDFCLVWEKLVKSHSFWHRFRQWLSQCKQLLLDTNKQSVSQKLLVDSAFAGGGGRLDWLKTSGLSWQSVCDGWVWEGGTLKGTLASHHGGSFLSCLSWENPFPAWNVTPYLWKDCISLKSFRGYIVD